MSILPIGSFTTFLLENQLLDFLKQGHRVVAPRANRETFFDAIDPGKYGTFSGVVNLIRSWMIRLYGDAGARLSGCR